MCRSTPSAPRPSVPPLSYESTPGAASAPLPADYRPRRPQDTALHQLVRRHLESFVEQGRRAHPDGDGYPVFIENEFRKYLLCGDISQGFSRLRCSSCGTERLVGFSCKGRMCPSCQARRAADTAIDLVDRLLPDVPYRQWVLSFPFELRFPLATDRALLSRMLQVLLRTLFAWQRRRGRQRGIRNAETGAVSFIQRFASTITVYPHFHCLVPDGVFLPSAEPAAPLRFVALPPPTQPQLTELTARIVERLVAVARKHLGDDALPDDPPSLLASCTAEALRSPRRTTASAEPPPKPLTVRCKGFSLHAARRVEAGRRGELERLCRYGLRAPFALERLSLLPDGHVRYELPRPTTDGRTELRLAPLAFLRRIAGLLPAPYTHLVRYHGVFANRSSYRPRLPRPPTREPAPPELPHQLPLAAPPQPEAPAPLPPRPARKPLPWAELLKRTLHVDGLRCARCSAPMVVLAFISDPRVVGRILRHLGLPTSPPPVAPAPDESEEPVCDPECELAELPPDEWDEGPQFPSDRGPPDDG